MQIRLLIADDHRLMRDGLKSLIEQEADMAVVAEAEDGKTTVAMVGEYTPHLVVMDVAMPDLNGIEATRKIVKENPGTKVLGLSGHTDDRFVREMLNAGASGYILKQTAYDELIQAIHAVIDGKEYLSPAVNRSIEDGRLHAAESKQASPAFSVLTDREREVLQLLAEGLSTKEMADSLDVSVKTVETHRRNIMDKLDLHSVAQLTKYAIREGVTSVDA